MPGATLGRTLSRAFYDRDPRAVAPDLLNKVLVVGGRAARLVEVEAYCGSEDPASHAYRGPTRRNAAMFGEPGRLYVYFTYGMHWCANAVCREEGTAGAVLLRAGEPVSGVETMWEARPAARRVEDLASGPAKVCQALGLDGDDGGSDLTDPAGRIRIVEDGTAPPAFPGRGVRVGIRAATGYRWRWWVPGNVHVSRPGRSTVSRADGPAASRPAARPTPRPQERSGSRPAGRPGRRRGTTLAG